MAVFHKVSTVCIQIPDGNGVLAILKNALILNDQLAMGHPYIYIGTCVFLLSKPVALTWPFEACYMLIRLPIIIARWFVRSLGFGNNTGIARDSFASHYQSINYGGYVPRDSVFSGMQSFGAYNEEEDEEQEIPVYARLLQIGVGILLIRCLYFLFFK